MLFIWFFEPTMEQHKLDAKETFYNILQIQKAKASRSNQDKIYNYYTKILELHWRESKVIRITENLKSSIYIIM